LNRVAYLDHVQQLIRTAFYYFSKEWVSEIVRPMEADQLLANELRRLLDLQLPQWILIAPTNGRFSRSLAIEEAIAEVDHKSGGIWSIAVSSAGETPTGENVTITPTEGKQVQAFFFSWARRRCLDALRGTQPKIFPAPVTDTFVIWDHVSKALTYYFQEEIANANDYLTHLVWFQDRVGTCLDGALHDWIDIRKRRAEVDWTAVRAGVDLVPKERIWHFALHEIAIQVGRVPAELVLPNRETSEAAFFSRVDLICTTCG